MAAMHTLLGVGIVVFSSAVAPAQDCLHTWTDGGFDAVAGFYVQGLAVFDDGDGPKLYAGSVSHLRRFDGNTWTQLANAVLNIDSMHTVELDGETMLLAVTSSSKPASRIRRWNGGEFTAFGLGSQDFITDLAVFAPDGSNEELYRISTGSIGRMVLTSEGEVSWTTVATISARCWPQAIEVFDDGTGPKLYAGGFFASIRPYPAGETIDGVNGIAVFDGTTWSRVGSGVAGRSSFCNNFGGIEALAVFDDGSGPALYAGGLFDSIDGVSAVGIARWNGVEWQAVGGATEPGNEVWELRVLDDGRGPALYAAGLFEQIGGVAALNVARWDGTTWEALGGGVPEIPNWSAIKALAAFPVDGQPAIWGGGQFQHIGGTAAKGIAYFSCVCPDLDDDGVVGLSDLALLLPEFGRPPAIADIDHDRDVDLQDLSTLLAAFGASCE